MVTKFRTALPFVWGGVVALLFIMSGMTFRFNLSMALPNAPDPEAITPFIRTLGELMSSREMAWGVFMLFSLLIRESRLTLWLFAYRIFIELQDLVTLFINGYQGRQEVMASVVIFTLVLVIFHSLAVWALYKREKS